MADISKIKLPNGQRYNIKDAEARTDIATVKAVSGSVVYFNDGADNFPLRKLVAQIEPNQSDLSGHNSVVISRANKNLVNISNFTVSSRTLKNIMTVGAGTYTLGLTIHCMRGMGLLMVCDTYETPISDTEILPEGATIRVSITFTVTEQTEVCLLCDSFDRIFTHTISDIQLEYGSEMTEYKAYSAPTTYTTALPETVYGGELDVLNGSGKSTKALYTFTGTESWTYSQGYQAWHVLLTGSSPKINTVPLVSNNVVMHIINNYDGISIRVYLRENPSITEETDMNALFSSGVKMIYELESAVSFTTSATEIRPLLNGNVFYADTGNIELEYRPNSKIVNAIVEIHESMPPSVSELSDTNITSPTNGQLFGYNGTSGKWENVLPVVTAVDSELSITSANPLENRVVTMALFSKANASDVYTKTQVDNALANKADTATTYTKSETDTLLGAKADANNTYTKTEVDTALQSKADANNVYSKSEVYTKSETNTALASKANSSSVYTKNEVYNKTETYNKAEIDSKTDITKSFSATPIATLKDAAENVPMKSLVVDIVPKQASGTPTPDNPLPISGSTEINVVQTGINICKNDFEQGTINGNTGADVTSTTTNRSGYQAIKPEAEYYCVSGYNVYAFFYDENKTYIGYHGSTLKNKSFIPQNLGNSLERGGSFANARFIRFRYDNGTFENDFSVNYPSTETTYHAPVTSTTHTITLPSTIYGGEVDVVSGSGTETQVILELDGSSDEYWSAYFSRNGFYINIPDMKTSNGEIGYSCNYLNVTSDWEKNLGIRYGANNKFIYCLHITDNLQDVTDVATWRTYLSNNPLVLTYPLATPTPITTTPIQIKTQGGTESIFADCGDVEGEYYTEQADDIVDLHNAIDAEKETVLAGTLTAGQTSITLSDASITSSSFIQVFADNGNVNYTTISATTGSVTIGFLAQASDMTVTVRVS